MGLEHLVYVSQARDSLDSDGLGAILKESRRYNAQHDITGALLFVEGRGGRSGSFMQLLEGPDEELETLRARIFRDARHHTKVVLQRGPLAARNFSEWSMAFRNVSPSVLAAHPKFADLSEPAFMDRCRRQEVGDARAFLRTFWDADPL
ncbi:BLUF domain-containing protein [Pararhizobium mangrovi]|nr:BLUF domain-containing protein [Pararhizobium mangrovi]